MKREKTKGDWVKIVDELNTKIKPYVCVKVVKNIGSSKKNNEKKRQRGLKKKKKSTSRDSCNSPAEEMRIENGCDI